MPAVTMVAAWMRAETGVGPAIASGSQTYSGICALLPVQPRRRARPTAVAPLITTGFFGCRNERTPVYCPPPIGQTCTLVDGDVVTIEVAPLSIPAQSSAPV